MSAAVNNSSQARPAAWVARVLAILLALGGCCWGLLLSPWLFRSDVSPLAIAVFGPGYVVTLGYIVRSLSTPTTAVCVLIWVSSLLVQGAWLLLLIWGVIEKAASGGAVAHEVASIPAAWWVFAFVASVAGLLADLPRQAELAAATDAGRVQ